MLNSKYNHTYTEGEGGNVKSSIEQNAIIHYRSLKMTLYFPRLKYGYPETVS